MVCSVPQCCMVDYSPWFGNDTLRSLFDLVTICDRIWENRPYRTKYKKRVISTSRCPLCSLLQVAVVEGSEVEMVMEMVEEEEEVSADQMETLFVPRNRVLHCSPNASV